MEGCVFNIQRYSVHDGPGIRTIIFLKGCPLRCRWCCNPESQMAKPEIAYNADKCIGSVCGLCQAACQRKNIGFADSDKIRIDHMRCTNCLSCAGACPAGAITCYGNYRTVQEIMDDVEQDTSFYSRSGGGLTLSGGEPLMQAGFVLQILREAKRRRINTAIETCGCARWEDAEEIFSNLDYVLFDVKNLDTEKHREWTGQGNEMILDTFVKMREAFPDLPVRVRTPVIPGFNDTEEEISKIRDFVLGFQNTEYEILPYHRYGMAKYEFLGREYKMGAAELDEQCFSRLKAICRNGC